jgi:hypothetical protein
MSGLPPAGSVQVRTTFWLWKLMTEIDPAERLETYSSRLVEVFDPGAV